MTLSRVCVYDNPASMSRECWQNGVLIHGYSSVLYALKVWPVPPEHYFFGANVGDWKPGQLIGDWRAMEIP